MARWLKNLLGIAILAFLFLYLARHWESLQNLVNLKLSTIIYLYIVSTVGGFCSSYTIQRILRTFKIQCGFWEMFHLNNATTLLNYLPAKFGTFYRANYLKRHYGLIYAHFGVLFLYLIILMTIAASIIGLSVIVTIYGLSKFETVILAIVFLVTGFFSVVIAFIPFPAIKGTGKIVSILRSFTAGREQMTKNKFELLINTLLTAASFVLSSIRLGIIYHSIGQNVHPAGYLVLGAVGYVSMFLAITPGSLGLRELALTAGAVALGIDPTVGALAAIIDRAIAIAWSFSIGVASTLYLWHKAPEDFKKDKEQISAL